MATRYTTKIGCMLALLVSNPLFSIMYDSRFFPMLWHPYVTVEDRLSHAALGGFFVTATSARGEMDKEFGIPALYGNYDQIAIAKALKAIGKPAVLPAAFQDSLELPWLLDGKVQGQGVTFSYQQQIGCFFSCGFYWYLMNLNSWQDYQLEPDKYTNYSPEERLALDQSRRVMHEELGLCGNYAHQVGMGDLDLYVRIGGQRTYELKCRTLAGGVRFGALLPTGKQEEACLPASFSFAGQGNFGIYGAADFEIEVKEDWKGGMLLYLDKRFSRTMQRRMPVGCEPRIFGPIVGCATIDPGVTFAWSPYASLENIRDGFGARVQYTIIHHDTDFWYDARGVNCAVPVNLEKVSQLSQWSSEYLTLNAFYDFGKMMVVRSFQPIVTLNWDIPVSWLVGENFCNTNIISLGIEWNF